MGDRGYGPHSKNHKNVGFLTETDLDPLENHKATKLAFNVGPYRPTSETPFKWRFAGGPIMAHL